MAQLENLEAKMASIEVSLSNITRKKRSGGVSNEATPQRLTNREIVVRELEGLRNALKDKENIIQSLKGQLGSRLPHWNGSCNRELTPAEKNQAEERLAKIRKETENKRNTIKNLKMALDRLDISDNIDVRIQQAELEYQLGREELNLLTLFEESRTLRACLDETFKSVENLQTIYSCVRAMKNAMLYAVDVVYDTKNPRFGAGPRDTMPGLWVDWALDETGLTEGDRILEVNGKLILTKTKNDLIRLLSAAPDPARLVVLRSETPTKKPLINCTSPSSLLGELREVSTLRAELELVKDRAEEAQKAKDGLRSDNLRLTHRISYLEEQVSELLGKKIDNSQVQVISSNPFITSSVKTNQNVTNINISSPSSNDLQVFQKGSQVTAFVDSLSHLDSSSPIPRDSFPSIRSKSSLSNVSNTHISAALSPHPIDLQTNHKHQRHKHKSSKSSMHKSKSSHCLEHSYYHTCHKKDYLSETSSAIEQIKMNISETAMIKSSNHTVDHNLEGGYSEQTTCRNGFNKAHSNKPPKCLTASEKYSYEHVDCRNRRERKSVSIADFLRRSSKSPCQSIIQSATEDEGRERHDGYSIKSLDYGSELDVREFNHKNLDYTSEPNSSRKLHPHFVKSSEAKSRPAPPKKPLRLSLHKAHSLQSVDTTISMPPSPAPQSEKNSKKAVKRNHKGETHHLPFFSMKSEKNSDGASVKSANSKGSYYSPFRWPPNLASLVSASAGRHHD